MRLILFCDAAAVDDAVVVLWLWLCESARLFCDLHGNELLYHKPKGGVTGQTAGYNAAPAGSVDMSKVSRLITTSCMIQD